MTRDVLQVLQACARAALFVLPLILLFAVAENVPETGIAALDRFINPIRILVAINAPRHPRSVLAEWAPVLGLWVFLLVAAMLADLLLMNIGKRTLAPISQALHAPSAKASVVTQFWDNAGLTTKAIGQFRGRSVRVGVQPNLASRRGEEFRVDMACRWAGAFNIRRKTLQNRMLAMCGETSVPVGNPQLDDKLLFSSDESLAFKDWLRRADVKSRILSLMFQHKFSGISTETNDEGERVLRGAYRPYRWFKDRGFVEEHITGMLDDLEGLAYRLDGRPSAGDGAGTS